jgi:glycosyltransferase involved in cell wall biosynthesis
MIAPQPFFRPRGTPFSVLHRIRALVKGGNTVDLVTYPFGDDVLLPGLTYHRTARPPWIRDVAIGPSLRKLVLDMWLYRHAVRLLRAKSFDVLHSHEEAAFFSIHLAKRHGLLHVYDMHSSLPHQLANFRAYDLGLFRALFGWLERTVLKTCDGVITICKELDVIALEHCGDTPHAMIENMADDRLVFGVLEDSSPGNLQLENRSVVLYTGTFEPYQGLELLLAAFREVHEQLPRAHLLLVGGRPEEILLYQRLAQELQIEQATTFVGTVHPSRIPSFLDVADIIVSPRSAGTNTPLKIYGYLRSGVPIVATDIVSHTQTLTPGLAHLVPPTSEGLAAGIVRVLEDPAYGRRLAEEARRLGEERYSDDVYLRLVLDLYERVLSAPARRARGRAAARRV